MKKVATFLVVASPLMVLLCAGAASAATLSDRFASRGADIHYTIDGSGPPVILIHGFTGSGARHFGTTGVIKAIGDAGFQAVAIDCRGHGMSSKPETPEAYGMRMVDDVVALLDHLHIRRAHIVGYSMGGWIATQMVVHHPSRVLTVTLLGSGWEGTNLDVTNQQMLAMANGFDRGDTSPLIESVTAGAQNGPTDTEMAAASADLLARNPPRVLAAIARSMRPLYEVRREQLSHVTIPVFAVVGEKDPRNVVSAGRLKGVVTGFDMVVIPDATHQSCVRPAAAIIVAFLARHRR